MVSCRVEIVMIVEGCPTRLSWTSWRRIYHKIGYALTSSHPSGTQNIDQLHIVSWAPVTLTHAMSSLYLAARGTLNRNEPGRHTHLTELEKQVLVLYVWVC